MNYFVIFIEKPLYIVVFYNQTTIYAKNTIFLILFKDFLLENRPIWPIIYEC